MLMSYADEGFYTDRYLLGRKRPSAPVLTFMPVRPARSLSHYTFGRLENAAKIPEAARLCCCELAETEYAREKQRKDAGGKTSEKIGTYSVSFGTTGESNSAFTREQRAIVMKWLGNTGLCYQGCDMYTNADVTLYLYSKEGKDVHYTRVPIEGVYWRMCSSPHFLRQAEGCSLCPVGNPL